ncbi:MAG: flagellar biosynthesis protein FlgM [Acidobacteria bacterium]|nr:flagellar biosynthesis protein FlgM [Acidobacteriota bacterium]
MKWEGRRGSGNIEDRRGMGMGVGLPLGGGIGGVVLLLIISVLTGTNPLDYVGSPNAPSSTGMSGVPDNDPQAQFIAVVLADTEETWSEIFQQAGRSYEPPVLVLFEGATQSGCGVGRSEVGPFYCPADQRVYLDLSFFRDLDQRFGAPGDFAQAYVVAHEVGHHIQTVLGTSEKVAQGRSSANPADANALSVRMKLQADCYAGVWGRRAAQRGLLEAGDAEEGLNAAASIGDDRLQRMGQGQVAPESFTHGSSAQRVQWLRRGLDDGSPDACDTFSSAAR